MVIKRAKLKQLLKDNKFDVSKHDFLNIEYNNWNQAVEYIDRLITSERKR